MSTIFIAIFCFFGQALAAPSSPDESWNDFTNNFATDIAPLVILFGEQVTKQFLSESTGLLDNIIFGMAPLGILTAVVSAIRIYGWPGLKAFIGRAQEPHGVAEAELCSSTSCDVCELWSEGGICRVFGRPKVLEFFHKAGEDDFYPKFTKFTTEKEAEQPSACNLYRPVCFLDGKKCCPGAKRQKSTDEQAGCGEKDSGWYEESAADSTKKGDPHSGVENGEEETKFAPYPNLSLNIGIRATPQWVLILVAAFGSLVQLSFFGYATYVTFYRPDFYTEGKAPETWSFVLTVLGTAMVVLGMILCAFLIERKSCERRFTDVGHDGAEHSKVDTTMYWLQPGNQRVGDQRFNAFSYNKVKHTYITSWKTDQGKDQLGSNHTNVILVIGLFSSMAGFIFQFTGLRGLHGSVALYQIAATLVMSIIRAMLRLRRLDPNDNNLRTIGTKVEGYELNWQAMNIFTTHASQRKASTVNGSLWTPMGSLSEHFISPLLKNVKSWRLSDEKIQFPEHFSCRDQKDVRQITSENCHSSSCLFGFQKNVNFTHPEATETCPVSLSCVKEAIHVASRYEGVFSNGLAEYVGPNPAAMITLFRSRLSYLTGNGIIGVQPKWEDPAREMALALQSAMQGVANYVFSGKMNIRRKWQETLALTWHTTAMVDYTLANPADQQNENISEPLCISFPMFQYGKEWKISKNRLEAVISLWASSLDRAEISNDLNDKVLIGNAEEDMYSALKLWIPTTNLKLATHDESATWTEAWSIQDQRLLPRKQETGSDYSGDTQSIILRAKSPKINLLAQNLFTIFISRLAQIVKEIQIAGEDLLSAWELSQAGTHEIPPPERSVGLSHTHIGYLTKLFVQSGLGTEEEAFMCIIPVFIQAGILPRKKAILNDIIQQARKLRRNKQFRRAHAILFAMLSSTHHGSNYESNGETRNMALREIGEVFRKAYFTQEKEWAILGLQEIERDNRRIIEENMLASRNSAPASTPKRKPNNQETDGEFGSKFFWDVNKRELSGSLYRNEMFRIFYRYNSLAKVLEENMPTEMTVNLFFNILSLYIDRYELEEALRWINQPEFLLTTGSGGLSALSLEKTEDLLLFLTQNSCVELSEDLLEAKKDLSKHIMGSDKLLRDLIEFNVGIQILEVILDTCQIHDESPNDYEKWGMALFCAIKARRADVVRLFLDRGAPANTLDPFYNANPVVHCVQDSDGKSPFMESLELLLEYGADANARLSHCTAVERACQLGNYTAVNILIEHRADLRNQFLLQKTAERGHTVLLQTLLEAGLSSEINEDYRHPFCHYLSKGYWESPQFPEAIKCFVGKVDYTFGTALHTAIQSNQAEVVEILLKRNDCNLNIQIGGTLSYAIIIACFMGSKRILDMLFAEGPRIDLNVVGRLGSALAVSCAKEDTIIVQKLIQKGAKVTESRGKLGSPLVLACLQGCDEIVGQLMRKDSTNKDCPGIGGLTPLCAAVKSSNLKIVQMLIREGADVNRASSSGTTPLLLAVSTEPTDLEIVTVLLKAKADTNKRGGEEVGHLSPLEVCREKGNEFLVEALKRAEEKDMATPPAEHL